MINPPVELPRFGIRWRKARIERLTTEDWGRADSVPIGNFSMAWQKRPTGCRRPSRMNPNIVYAVLGGENAASEVAKDEFDNVRPLVFGDERLDHDFGEDGSGSVDVLAPDEEDPRSFEENRLSVKLIDRVDLKEGESPEKLLCLRRILPVDVKRRSWFETPPKVEVVGIEAVRCGVNAAVAVGVIPREEVAIRQVRVKVVEGNFVDRYFFHGKRSFGACLVVPNAHAHQPRRSRRNTSGHARTGRLCSSGW